MSANEHAARSQDAPNEASSGTPSRGAVDHNVYYATLAERLEDLLRDMQEKGTPADDALLLRLADLLSETRGHMRKASRQG